MAETVQIRRFASTYRLRPSELQERTRLDRLVPQLLGEPLELALERAGIGSGELVCIRRIRIPVRLRLSRSDSELLAAWAGELAHAVASGVAEALRYSSRSLALVEMGTHLSERRFHNAWAWRQLGFWRLPAFDIPSAPVAAAELAATLEREPSLALAVLIALARNGSLRRVLEHMGEGLVDVVASLLALAGHSARSIEDLLRNLESRVFSAGGYLDSRTEIRARQVVSRSSIFASAEGLELSEAAKAALYLIASLECEPSLALRTPSAITESIRAIHVLNVSESVAIPAVRQPLKPAPGPNAAATSEKRHPPLRPFSESADELPGDAPQAAPQPDFFGNESATSIRSASSEPPADSIGEPAASTSTVFRGDPASAFRGSSGSDSSASEIASPPASSSKLSSADNTSVLNLTPPYVRPHPESSTRFGGLLFLLRILDRLNIPARMMATPIAMERGLRWMLHQLALVLQSLSPDDPAALAFCGLTPEAPPPSEEVPPPSPDEQSSLDSFAAEIRTSLDETLADAFGNSHLPERTVQFVCRRYARVLADPGWIELHFSLQDVSTPIRAAGLDLDPNYVPWLGVVIRFLYE
jgi:hypothetical protein